MDKTRTRLLLAIGLIFWGLIYSLLASWYLTSAKIKNNHMVQNHADIIADDVWNLNRSGMDTYLRLVAETSNYKTIEILLEDGQVFLQLSGPELQGLDKILLQTGLLPTEHVAAPVYYNQHKIGLLQGERYPRHVYPLFYIFLILCVIIFILIFILHLIYHRHLLEKQVKERTKKYQDLVNLLPEMVLETDAEGIITFANEKAAACFNIRDLEAHGYDCKDFICQADGTRGDRSIYLNAQKDDIANKEYRGKDVSGNLFPVLVRSAPIYEDSVFTGARMIIIDITERQALEEQLTRDQKMKFIGMMAGGVAHDLNNILSGIVNYPELLLHKLPEDSPLIKFVKPIKEAGLRAAAVVADLLTVARGVAASKEAANLNTIINDYFSSPEFHKLKSSYPNIEYIQNLAPDLSYISCSIIHVRKSLMNLVNNASEAVEGEGRVIIETKDISVDTPLTTEQGIISPGPYAVLSVQDTGKGIDSVELKRIFEPFFSKKELGRSGTGLGLTIVANAMQDHGGNISVTSCENGTTFQLFFPGLSNEKRSAEPAKKNLAYFGNGESILIVDDELQQRDIATELLTSLGYKVKSVESGEGAIDYLQKRQVDLVLLDMIMESGMNGLATYEEIIKIYPKQKAVILSGFSESDDVKKTIEKGAGGLINKPYTKEQLARAVYNELKK